VRWNLGSVDPTIDAHADVDHPMFDPIAGFERGVARFCDQTSVGERSVPAQARLWQCYTISTCEALGEPAGGASDCGLLQALCGQSYFTFLDTNR
jgi:hypothetical protein